MVVVALTFWRIWWKIVGDKKQRDVPSATSNKPMTPRLTDLFVHGLIATQSVSSHVLVLVSSACALLTLAADLFRRLFFCFSHSLVQLWLCGDTRFGVCEDKTYLIYQSATSLLQPRSRGYVRVRVRSASLKAAFPSSSPFFQRNGVNRVGIATRFISRMSHLWRSREMRESKESSNEKFRRSTQENLWWTK